MIKHIICILMKIKNIYLNICYDLPIFPIIGPMFLFILAVVIKGTIWNNMPSYILLIISFIPIVVILLYGAVEIFWHDSSKDGGFYEGGSY